ncbi:MAG: galactonate dehydratase [Rhodobacteraceae bacterium]|uniref:Galactonate dehydratase n=1 Tax=Salipiger profundus TaxID=1229727 RepID=A0A1U7D8E0_9RHOB|nr:MULTISPECIES: galactonate dehydratase [Salipiger]APX24372.1 galactonate dehydratase [Salipiger profundus]MAB07325.1 galactonate dehydratase [Paracoccaceae bacterium]GGA19483.1 galactonate dehydratase [Salipiger profundus]SFD36757.1 galactonate dehydratase [Salipiger profundus]
MRITGISAVTCNAQMRNWVFVRVDTDVPGLIGWGEATLEWKTRSVIGAIADLEPLLVGMDPRDIEQCFQVMTRHGFWRMGVIGMSAISGIEIALWDILGKSLDTPVWRLLGGKCRDHLRTYTHLGMGNMSSVYETDGAEELAERGRQVVDAGYDAVKVVSIPYAHYIAPNRAIDSVGMAMDSLRQAVGPDVDIMVDFHGRPASAALARDFLRALEPARPLFAEEPVPPEQIDNCVELTRTSRISIAAGERLIGRAAFEDAIRRRAFHIAQPDIVHVGGISEAKKIAAICETAGIGVAPHNPLGPIAGIAALHFGVSTPNHIIQEEMVGAVPWYDDVVQWPIDRTPGRWDLPEKPGLGLEVNEAEIARHPFEQEVLHTRNAVMPDGTVVDW